MKIRALKRRIVDYILLSDRDVRVKGLPRHNLLWRLKLA